MAASNNLEPDKPEKTEKRRRTSLILNERDSKHDLKTSKIDKEDELN